MVAEEPGPLEGAGELREARGLVGVHPDLEGDLHGEPLGGGVGDREDVRARLAVHPAGGVARAADADAVEAYNHDQPRLGRVVRGESQFAEVQAFEQELDR